MSEAPVVAVYLLVAGGVAWNFYQYRPELPFTAAILGLFWPLTVLAALFYSQGENR